MNNIGKMSQDVLSSMKSIKPIDKNDVVLFMLQAHNVLRWLESLCLYLYFCITTCLAKRM